MVLSGRLIQPGEGSSHLGKIHVDAVLSTAQRSLPALHHTCAMTASSQMGSWKLTLIQRQKEQALDDCSRAVQTWRASSSLLNQQWSMQWSNLLENNVRLSWKQNKQKENTKQPNKTIHQSNSSMQVLKPDFKGRLWKGWPATRRASAPASPFTLPPPDVAPTHLASSTFNQHTAACEHQPMTQPPLPLQGHKLNAAKQLVLELWAFAGFTGEQLSSAC